MPALDSTLHDVNSGSQVLESRFHLHIFQITKELFSRDSRPGFWIPKSRIPDSSSKHFLDSGFHKQKFPGFKVPGLPYYMGRSPKHLARQFKQKSLSQPPTITCQCPICLHILNNYCVFRAMFSFYVYSKYPENFELAFKYYCKQFWHLVMYQDSR